MTHAARSVLIDGIERPDTRASRIEILPSAVTNRARWTPFRRRGELTSAVKLKLGPSFALTASGMRAFYLFGEDGGLPTG
jgi:hypothetical protein